MLILLLTLQSARAALPDEALVALRRADCPTALRALARVQGVEAALARARCGQLDGADAALARGGPLEPYLRLAMARALVDQDPDRARALLQGVTLPGAAGLELRLVRGRALVAAGQSLDARADLRALLSTPLRAEALYWLARGAQDRGDAAAAIDAFRTLWAEEVASPFSAAAAPHLAALGAPVPDFQTDEGRALALRRARALVRVHRAEEAIPLYDGVGAATGDGGAAWHHELGMALFKAKDYPRAVATLALLNPESPGVKGGADTLFHYALGTSRTGDYAAAARRYARLVELYPGTSTADTASFKIAYLDQDAGRHEAAIAGFEAHLKRFPATRHADETWWFMGWSLYKLGRLDEAMGWFETLLRQAPRSSLAPGAWYWKARVLGQRGDAAAERAELEALLRAHPASSHASFAAQRLGRRFEGLGEVTPPPIPEAFALNHPEVAEARLLADAGQFEWARERLVSLTGPASAADRETRLALAHALIDLGAFQAAQALARPYCGAPWGERPDALALTACHPRPESPVVDAAARASGLDPLLPYAIMTAESALDPAVTSIAGARGLMQLMPSLAADLHAELIPNMEYDPDQLYVSGYNAWLGTTELGRLHQRFGDAGVSPSLPLVIAGYNGGAEAVARWLEGYAEPPEADVFAEDISYTETRRYVRRVLGFHMTYRWVYGDG